MESSCREEDKLAEMAAAKFAHKFQGSNGVDKYAVKNSNDEDKYTFLQLAAQATNMQSTEVDILCVNLDAIDSDRNGESVVLHNSGGAEELLVSKRMSEEDDSSPRAASAGKSHLNFVPRGPLCSDELVDVSSDAHERMSERYPSTSSDIAEEKDGVSADHSFGVRDMGDVMAVTFHPDYIVYRNRYYKDCVLCFSSHGIKMNGSIAYGNQETSTFQWGIEDIIDIESQWFGRHEIAFGKVRVMLKEALQAENAVDCSSIEELEFAVADPDWYDKQEVITSLHGYNARWNVVFDTDVESDGEALLGQNNQFLTLRYFPNFDESFEDVVYPAGDSDAVSISRRDVDLLQPDTFVNDTIIDFYIKYLKNRILPEDSDRFHFFNSFFFRKLADLDKDPSTAFEGKVAFQRVRKWTRKVNLFKKDYIFIPVNFNYHWSLIAICHPGEVAKFQDKDVEKSPRVPCILHMDSIRGSHTGLRGLMQSYLWEEWKERQKEMSEDMSSRFFNLRFVSLELPQQQNLFDCGLFLLHYVECFLDEVPKNFNPFNITKFSNFLNVDWFQPEEASLKRVQIQKLIYNLLENRSQEISSLPGNNVHSIPDFHNDETVVEFLLKRGSPSKICHGKLHDDQGIDMTLLPVPSLRNSLCAGDPHSRDFFGATASSESFLDAQYQALDQTQSLHVFKSAMSPMEEDVAAGAQFAYPPVTDNGLQCPSGITSEACGFTCSREFGVEASCNPGTPVHEDIDTSQETSSSASDGSLGGRINESSPVRRGLDFKEKIDQSQPESTENAECLTECFTSTPSELLDAAVSGCPGQMLIGNDAYPLTSCLKNLPEYSHKDDCMPENDCITDNDDDNLEPESGERHVAKKMRTVSP